MSKKWLLISVLATILTGCTSTPVEDLGHVRVGMDKSTVLDVAGSPKYTFRENGEDNWMYAYYSNHRNWKRDVVFKNGKVIKIGHPFAIEKWLKDAKASKNLDEYERHVRDHQRQTRGKFENIDGQKGAPDSP